MKTGIGALFIIVCAALATPQAPTSNRVVRIGGISGEIGTFALSQGMITVYSDKSISVQFGTNPKRQYLEYSESVSFEVKGESMRRSQDKIPLALPRDFEFCDPLNQVNLPGERKMRLALPKNARIKTIEELSDKRTLVVYSASDNHVAYEIRLVLLQSDTAQKYTIIGGDNVSKDGTYCGIQTMDGDHRVVLVDEPSGSSDFSAVYVYALKP